MARAGDGLRPGAIRVRAENTNARPASVFNVFIPGGFEERMPAIVDWYRTNRIFN